MIGERLRSKCQTAGLARLDKSVIRKIVIPEVDIQSHQRRFVWFYCRLRFLLTLECFFTIRHEPVTILRNDLLQDFSDHGLLHEFLSDLARLHKTAESCQISLANCFPWSDQLHGKQSNIQIWKNSAANLL